MFLVPLVVRQGWGRDALLVQALLAALIFDGCLDIFGYRKQVWIVIGMAGGLAYLARHARTPDGPTGGSLRRSGDGDRDTTSRAE